MGLEHTLKLIGLKLSPYRLAQMRWLERRGLRFLIDFGTDNAHAKVREVRAKTLKTNLEIQRRLEKATRRAEARRQGREA